MPFEGDLQDRAWVIGQPTRQVIVNGSIRQSDRSFDLSGKVDQERPIDVVDLQDTPAGQQVTVTVKV